ncbi:MAG: cation:proton antiporter [Candidatus Bipolaricaulia bacterium]
MEEFIQLVFQLGVILLAAKLGGELFERFLKQPGVLGELIAGVIIGPHALGGLITLPQLGTLFDEAETVAGLPVSSELHAIAQIGVIVLLFHIGLEADLRGLLRFGGIASLIALGGVVVPFVVGVQVAILLGYADGLSDPVALFMGTVLTATSVGITTRVLDDIRKLRTPEGTTILGSAIIDDILGVLILTVVVGIAEGEGVRVGGILGTAGKAIGFWLVLTALIVAFSDRISRFLSAFRSQGALIALALGLVFIGAALAELFELAAIIGAFSVGLGLSTSNIARTLRDRLRPIYDLLVPIFFVVMGMSLDVRTLGGVIGIGLLIGVLAILTKVIGSGLPALALRFTPIGALRVGVGMAPRGEVALVIIGTATAMQAVEAQIFSVVILMVFITTLVTPPLLLAVFNRGGVGRKVK